MTSPHASKREGKRSHAALGRELAQRPGFDEGRIARQQIMRLGAVLRTLRTEHLGVTQTQAAGLVRMRQAELARIENGSGERGPHYLTVVRILDAYQRKLDATGIELNLAVRVRRRNASAENLVLAGDATAGQTP